MTDEEKRIVKKLKAIINNTPYPGEKATAMNVLKNYCLKHGITSEQLDVDEEKEFEYIITDKYHICLYLLKNISFWVFKRHEKRWSDESFSVYVYCDPRKKAYDIIRIRTTTAVFLEIIGEFEVYNVAFKKQLNNYIHDKRKEFTRAFLEAHDLLIPSDEVEPKQIGKINPKDDEKRLWEAASYLDTLGKIEHVTVYKQLENHHKKNNK